MPMTPSPAPWPPMATTTPTPPILSPGSVWRPGGPASDPDFASQGAALYSRLRDTPGAGQAQLGHPGNRSRESVEILALIEPPASRRAIACPNAQGQAASPPPPPPKVTAPPAALRGAHAPHRPAPRR